MRSGTNTSLDRTRALMANPRRGLWSLAGPMIASMSVHTVYLLVDFAFIGQVGDEAVAGVTLVGPLFFVVIALLTGVGIAVTALTAQALGREDVWEASRVASSSLTLSLGIGTLLGLGGVLFGPEILRLAGAKGAVLDSAWAYFQLISITVPVFFVGGALRAVLTGEGNAKTPMMVLFVSSAINLGLDALFILGLGWGVRGAALATLGASVFSLSAFAWIMLFGRRSGIQIVGRFLGLHRPLLEGILRIGLPAAIGQLIMAAGSAANNRLLTEFGDHALAGYGAASRVDMIVAMPILGLAGAAVTMIGMFAGAGRPDLVRQTALYTYRWSLLMAVVVGLAAWLGSVPLMRIFVDDEAAVSLGRTYLLFMLASYPMMAFGMTTGRILQGLGHGLPSLVITTLRVLAIGVPSAYVAVYAFGAPVEAVWASMLAGGAASTVLSLFWVRLLLWRRNPTERAQGRGHPAPSGALSGAQSGPLLSVAPGVLPDLPMEAPGVASPPVKLP